MSSEMKRQLIIDSDGVADDVRAIALALCHPGVEVIALTAVHGCTTARQAAANFRRTLRACNVSLDIPIYLGAEGPLLPFQRASNETYFFGADGLGDLPENFPKVLDSDVECWQSEHAALALSRIIRAHPEATLVCLGPLSNLALALKLDPEIATRLHRLVLMGGNYYAVGNVSSRSSAEYNFSADPEAAEIVLAEMRCPVQIVPWECFFLEGPQHQRDVDFHAHLRLDNSLAAFLRTTTGRGRDYLKRNGRQYAFCDEIAVGVAIDPDAVVAASKEFRVSVELAGTLSRGQVVVDWTNVLWSAENEDSMDPGRIDKSRPLRTFITSYNCRRLAEMVTAAVQSTPLVSENCQDVVPAPTSV